MPNPHAKYIVARLAEIGVSQADIARELGVTRQGVGYAIRHGRTSNPICVFIAHLLGDPVERWFRTPQKTGPRQDLRSRRRKLIASASDAIADGEISEAERRLIIKEADDLVVECLRLKGYLAQRRP